MTLYDICAGQINRRMMRPGFIFLMNLLAVPALILWTMAGVLLFPVGFVFMRLVMGYSSMLITRKCIWIYGRVWQFFLRPFVTFSPIEIHGNPFKEPGVIVVNHRSFFDTYCMNMMPVSDVCFAVRDWPFKIPLYNIFMNMAGYINIETFIWDDILKVAGKNFKNSSYILFFPEGHRSKTREMTAFYSGAFKLAIENNVPVIPICLTGTEDLLPPGRHFMKPAHIKMQVLDPVYPEPFQTTMGHIAYKRAVKEKMDRVIRQMEGGLE